MVCGTFLARGRTPATNRSLVRTHYIVVQIRNENRKKISIADIGKAKGFALKTGLFERAQSFTFKECFFVKITSSAVLRGAKLRAYC